MGYSEAVYQMLFLKAKALKDAKPGLSLEILHHLRAIQPRDYDVHRIIGEIHFRRNDFGSALWIFYLLYIRRKDIVDLRYFLCSSIYRRDFRFFFGDMRIHMHAGDAFIEDTVDRLLRKGSYRDHTVIFGNSLSPDGQIAGHDKATLESVVKKIYLNGPDIRKTALFGSIAKSHGIAVGSAGERPSAERKKIKITHDEFNVLYRIALQKIKNGEIADGLDVLLVAYGAGSCLELLEFLKNHEKMEVLYFLSRASPIFQRYYDEAVQATRNAKIQTLHLLLLGECSSLTGELIEIL